MDLTEYLFKYNINNKQIAKDLGITPVAISRIKTGKMTPSLATAIRIYIASEEKVDLGTLLSAEEKKKVEEWKAKRSIPERTERKTSSVLVDPKLAKSE